MEAADQVNAARRGAGLTQRQLAAVTGIPQSAIARIERGHQVPRADTLQRLLDACGFELRLAPKRGTDEDQSLIRTWLDLTPAERARRSAAYGQMAERFRRARPAGPAR